MPPKPKHPSLTVGDFHARHAEALGLSLLGSGVGFARRIKEPTINRPGLALAGFLDYFAEKRIQVLGSAELAYLKSLSPKELNNKVSALVQRRFPCLVIARGLRAPKELLAKAEEAGLSVFRTPMVTMRFINAATLALESEFAATLTQHGSMVDVMGVGVMIQGASGIGKSECVLGLIERGHSLVADDVTRLRVTEGSELVGAAPPLTRHHMEVHGLGIINVSAIFGVGAVRVEKTLNLVVTLKDWQELEEVDRIGLEQEFCEILGIRVPHKIIPVRTGRDLARLVEVAAMDQKLRSMGQNSALEFNQRLLDAMKKPQ